MQKWKLDPNLYNCERDEEGKKCLDYYNEYVHNFLSSDPLRDWESIERCKELWLFFLREINQQDFGWKILDAGTKDGQFPQWLNKFGKYCIGIEIDDQYVDYAQSMKRPVIKGDVCNINFNDDIFDVIFSHHVLGLCPDYKKAYQEMLRVCKKDGYIITLADIPGNLKKHYSMVNDIQEVKEMLKDCPKHDIMYEGYWNNKRKSEYVFILKRI